MLITGPPPTDSRSDRRSEAEGVRVRSDALPQIGPNPNVSGGRLGVSSGVVKLPAIVDVAADEAEDAHPEGPGRIVAEPERHAGRQVRDDPAVAARHPVAVLAREDAPHRAPGQGGRQVGAGDDQLGAEQELGPIQAAEVGGVPVGGPEIDRGGRRGPRHRTVDRPGAGRDQALGGRGGDDPGCREGQEQRSQDSHARTPREDVPNIGVATTPSGLIGRRSINLEEIDGPRPIFLAASRPKRKDSGDSNPSLLFMRGLIFFVV